MQIIKEEFISYTDIKRNKFFENVRQALELEIEDSLRIELIEGAVVKYRKDIAQAMALFCRDNE